MQGIMESIFDGAYLLTVLVLGLTMCFKSKNWLKFRLFGLMSIILAVGDAFHLVPRVHALLTTGLDANAFAIGTGKLITSITVTIFYLLLYYFWRLHYEVRKNHGLTISIWILTVVRIVLCLLPQNQWTSLNSPIIWGILRNIPFLIMGLIVMFIFLFEARKNLRTNFKWAWLAIALSFALYVPVVLFADRIPEIGLLMIPKTLAYVWIISMGFKEFRSEEKINRSW